MAEPVEDAMRVYIPLNPERTTPAAAGLVNINHASGTELETLPGIGAKTADKIIEYRNEHGGFRSKEELKEVPTIGEGSTPKCQSGLPYETEIYISLVCFLFGCRDIFASFLSFLFLGRTLFILSLMGILSGGFSGKQVLCGYAALFFMCCRCGPYGNSRRNMETAVTVHCGQ